jgi:hypothetical protein
MTSEFTCNNNLSTTANSLTIVNSQPIEEPDNEPMVLYPTNFCIKSHTIEQVHDKIQIFLQDYTNLFFCTSRSSWSGSILNKLTHTQFKIVVYKRCGQTGVYVIGVQFVEGDGFMFRNFYIKLKQIFNITTLPNALYQDEDDEEESDEWIPQELKEHVSNVADKFSTQDYETLSHAIFLATEICWLKEFRPFIYECNIISHMVDFLNNNDINFDNWDKHHTLMALAHLCETSTDSSQLKNFLLLSDKYIEFMETIESIIKLPSTDHRYQHAIKHATTIIYKLK